MKQTLLVGVALLMLARTASAQTTTQTFQLRSGWNSIWLEVQPTNNRVSAVFAGVPVASVWTYVPNGQAVQFVRDQNEVAFNETTWLRYLPAGTPESFLNNLFTVSAGRAYLVKVTAPATLTLTGRPSVTRATWQPDSFNLRGFPLNPAQLPTFAGFFAPSAAHAGQPVYQLNSGGQWAQVNAGDLMKAGEAYWAFCQGASTYQAPLGFELELGDGLDFAEQLTQLAPRLRNNGTTARTVSVTDLGQGASGPLSYQRFANNQFSWITLPAPHSLSLGARGTTTELRELLLAIRRKDISQASYASVLEVKDNAGTRYLVPVTARQPGAARSSLADGGSAAAATNRVAGLWVGTASITAVNVPGSPGLNLQPTRSPFNLRLLLHVAADSRPRLLKEVIQMWQESTRTNDAAGNLVVEKPGRFVLLTDDTLLPQFEGGVLRGGQSAGRRFSTVDYDFAAGSSNYLAMSGGFGPGQTAQCTFTLEPTFPTNPFLHRYHPDHDNKNALFQPLPSNQPVEQQEVYRITRAIELSFSATDPAGTNSLASIEYGDSALGGTYRETITGLHKTNLVASGSFRLTRVNNTPVLNQ